MKNFKTASTTPKSNATAPVPVLNHMPLLLPLSLYQKCKYNSKIQSHSPSTCTSTTCHYYCSCHCTNNDYSNKKDKTAITAPKPNATAPVPVPPPHANITAPVTLPSMTTPMRKCNTTSTTPKYTPKVTRDNVLQNEELARLKGDNIFLQNDFLQNEELAVKTIAARVENEIRIKGDNVLLNDGLEMKTIATLLEIRIKGE